MPRPLRVLQIIESLARAGAEQSTASLAPHLMTSGIDLHLAYLIERDGLRPQLEANGVPLHCLALPTQGHHRGAWLSRASHLVGDLKPDLVHTVIFEADVAGRLAAARHRVPCVSSLVNVAYGPTENQGLPRLRLRAAQGADIVTGRIVTRWHALTHYVADVMSRRLLIPRSRIEVIGRGREQARLGRRSSERRLRVRSALGLLPGTPIVLAVGRQERQKGLDVLFSALPEVQRSYPDVLLLHAGRLGNETDNLTRLREELGLGGMVRMMGVRDDVPDLMAAADVLAFPSRWEGAGGTLLEAMALECPIVATDHPALVEVIGRNTAVLAPPDQPPALAAAICSVLDDPALSAVRAAQGRQRFEAYFTMAAIAHQTVDFYQRVASTRQARIIR